MRSVKMVKRAEIKILGVSLLIGLVVGVLDYFFGSVLLKIGDLRTDYFKSLIGWLPIVGLVIVFAYQRFGKEASKGMALLFDVHQNEKQTIPIVLIPLIMVSTWLTHLFGGSAGREGVAVQIGGTIGNKAYQWLSDEELKPDMQQLFLMMGMAAGFGGLFQTPLAATVFAFEVFRTENIKLKKIIYVLIASLTSDFVTSSLGLEKFNVLIGDGPVWWRSLSSLNVMKWLLMMVCLYVIGKLFAVFLKRFKGLLNRSLPNPYLKMTILSIVLAISIYFIGQGRYSGLGTNLIQDAFYQSVTSYDWLLKMVFTVLTLAIGFQGGEVTPLFSIGASFSFAFASFVGLPILPAVALGYIGVFSSASHTFVTAIFLAYEVFGWQMVPLALIQAVVFYLIKQEISIYPMKASKTQL
ncbi:voltage-gated chloride channel protein [Vagococcus zengguangii]|uniref:Voltage-gated chloride channel protein n=2 Tax=Vagococcus zengguangii TaxID=2571750 RepID=A0A4D7CTI9_9ENTE|nr:voltage-gated chloride channel protein [Vagococcus zengguangii]